MQKSGIKVVLCSILIFLLSNNLVFSRAIDSKPHPILDWSRRIMGGTLEGRWLNRDEIAKHLVGGERYRVYSQVKFLGEFKGAKPSEERYISGDTGYRVELKDSHNKGVINSVVGIAGDWNGLPRVPRVMNNKTVQDDKFIAGVLKKNGIAFNSIHIQSRILIDLENDGVQEEFIIASNITDKIIDDLLNGKEIIRDNLYNLVVLRRKVKSKEEHTILAANYKELYLNELAFIADVDGDGQMEFLIRRENIEACQAEGFSTRVQDLYDIEDTKVKKLFSNYACPI